MLWIIKNLIINYLQLNKENLKVKMKQFSYTMETLEKKNQHVCKYSYNA